MEFVQINISCYKKNDWRTPGHNLISKSHRKEGATQKTNEKKKKIGLTPPPLP